MQRTDGRIFPEAGHVVAWFLDALDARAPGLIVGAHLTGSIALGDGRPDQSDIDLVLIRSEWADNTATMAALEPVLAYLRQTHPRPVLDGLVLDADDLEAGPDRIAGDRPIIFDYAVRLGTDGSGRNPVTWQTLRQCGITVRGEPIDPNRLWRDPARLDAWTRENLEAYWRPWLARSERLAGRDDLAALLDEATEWSVLGVTRLYYTLATGLVTSKHGAGVYALDVFPSRWRPIVEAALRIREQRAEPARLRNARARLDAMRAYVQMAIEEALALPARHEFRRPKGV